MSRTRIVIALVLSCSAFALLAACGDDAVAGDTPLDPELGFVTELRSLGDVAVLSASEHADEVKYLAQVDGAEPLQPLIEACYFQNMHHFPWHLQFMQSFPELAGASLDSYRNWVLRGATRRMWGGSIKYWPRAAHPESSKRGVISYEVYGEPGAIDVDDIASVDAKLKSCMPFANALLVFVPNAPDQQGLVMRERNALRERGVAAVLPDDLIDADTHVAYTEGESYGFLRVVPLGSTLDSIDYGPRDIIVVESSPNDISIVAGLLTKNPQNELGHVNLRLHEKGTPNAAVPKIYDAAWLDELDTKLVHLRVSTDAFDVSAADPKDAQAFWDAHRPSVRKPSADLDVTDLTPLTELRASDASAFGAKCANLGELTHVLDAPHRPDGFGVPFSRYRDFARDAELSKAIDDFLAAPERASDAAFKRNGLKALRKQIRDTPLDPKLFAALQAAIEASFGAAGRNKFMRFRSSTNVEDLDDFTGAGLYDSHSGCLADDLDDDATGPSRCLTKAKQAALEKDLSAYQSELSDHPERSYLADIIADIEGDLSDEKPVSKAVRKVFASLWTERAFDEREYYGIEHGDAYMGLAVHPSFELERANAVAVSNLKVDDGAPLYRVNSQVGELSVVTPEDPSAVAELLTFRREHTPPEATQISVQLPSSRVSAGEEVWPRAKLLELSQLLFRVHDHFAAEVYTDISQLALDFEVKLESNGDVSIKQVRPYLSNEP